MNRIIIKITSILSFCILSTLTSCHDYLDIPPENMVTEDQIFDNEIGITAYFAKLYQDVPMMDRRYSPNRRYNHDYVTENFSCLTGEAIGRDQSSHMVDQYWDGAYSSIRNINSLIEILPKYAEYHSKENYNHWMGEAHFLRALTYTAFAQRYGGISLVLEVLNYPEEDIESFMIHRSSEEDTWKQIERDYQFAIDNCKPNSSSKSRVNKYTAAAYKSTAMLFAASIANFSDIVHFDTKRNIQLCGIPKTSIAYFYNSAYEATKIFDGGPYSLYRGDWVENDKDAQFINYHNIHQKSNNSENIFVKEFNFEGATDKGKTHSWDALYNVFQQKVDGLSGGVHPTLEFVELFDGMNKDANGKLEFTNPDGTYIMYDNLMDPYKDAEPRLRANVIFPDDEFKGEKIGIYLGIYKPTIAAGGLKKLFDRDAVNVAYTSVLGDDLLFYTGSQIQSGNPPLYTKKDGTKMRHAGESGPAPGFAETTTTGFYLRKNLDSELEKDLVVQRRSVSDWVDMRYAEVLLNRAEAAFELTQMGEGNYMNDAAASIDDIRKRAGCTNFYDASTLTRDIIRDEFIRELAFENKAYWNLARWRILHIQHDAQVHYHAAMPFYSADLDKWFYDVKYSELGKTFTFNPMNYYVVLPDNQISANPNIVQNPN